MQMLAVGQRQKTFEDLLALIMMQVWQVRIPPRHTSANWQLQPCA